ncbi:unnamed protein product [Rhizophagus irregularis]|nr:unnamed protein product [Rhizophagus irregularis]
MSSQNKLHVSDKQLFTINLFSAFVNNNYIKTDKNDWYQQIWKDGIKEAEALGLHSSLMPPIIIMAIIHGLGTDYSNWFIPNYERIKSSTSSTSSVYSKLHFLNPFKNFKNFKIFKNSKINLSNAGIKIEKFFNNIKLNENEEKIFNKFIIIEELEDIIIFLLSNEILKNEKMTKCFVENFTMITTFSKKKLFKIYFIENNNVIKLFKYYFLKIFNLFYSFYSKKYDYEEIIYEILTRNFNEFRIEELMDNNIRIFMVDLKKFYIKNYEIKFVLKIWNEMNDNKNLMTSKL